MKNKPNVQLHNEFIGQAILDLIFQNIPVTESSLINQLARMQSRTNDPVLENELGILINKINSNMRNCYSEQRNTSGTGQGISKKNSINSSCRVKKNKLH